MDGSKAKADVVSEEEDPRRKEDCLLKVDIQTGEVLVDNIRSLWS